MCGRPRMAARSPWSPPASLHHRRPTPSGSRFPCSATAAGTADATDPGSTEVSMPDRLHPRRSRIRADQHTPPSRGKPMMRHLRMPLPQRRHDPRGRRDHVRAEQRWRQHASPTVEQHDRFGAGRDLCRADTRWSRRSAISINCRNSAGIGARQLARVAEILRTVPLHHVAGDRERAPAKPISVASPTLRRARAGRFPGSAQGPSPRAPDRAPPDPRHRGSAAAPGLRRPRYSRPGPTPRAASEGR